MPICMNGGRYFGRALLGAFCGVLLQFVVLLSVMTGAATVILLFQP